MHLFWLVFLAIFNHKSCIYGSRSLPQLGYGHAQAWHMQQHVFISQKWHWEVHTDLRWQFNFYSNLMHCAWCVHVMPWVWHCLYKMKVYIAQAFCARYILYEYL